jgi:hypothetical protein
MAKKKQQEQLQQQQQPSRPGTQPAPQHPATPGSATTDV